MRLVLIGAVLLAGCSEQDANDSDTIALAPPGYPIAQATAAVEEEGESRPLPVIRQSHYYEERRGETYYYIAAISEEDRKRGIAIGSVSGFQYLGQNDAGEHILASINDNGSIAYRAKCAASCRIIDTDYGRKIAYSPTSIIGSAFDDAFNGRLRIAEETRARLAPHPTPSPQVPAAPLPAPEQAPAAIDAGPTTPERADPVAQAPDSASPALAD